MRGTGSRLRRSPLPSSGLAKHQVFSSGNKNGKLFQLDGPFRPDERPLTMYTSRDLCSGSWHQVLTQSQDGGCFRSPPPPRLTIPSPKHTRYAQGSILRVTGTHPTLTTTKSTHAKQKTRHRASLSIGRFENYRSGRTSISGQRPARCFSINYEMIISLIEPMNDSRSEGQIAIVLIARTIRLDLAMRQIHRKGSKMAFD